MSLVLDHPHLVDTLRFRIQVQRSLPQETVRLTLGVLVLVRGTDRDQKGIERRIREALGDFIKADWVLSRIERAAEAAGYEKVTLSAVARVSAAENYDLAERARKASREGLRLGVPHVDYDLSVAKVNEVVDELRIEAMRRVTEYLPKVNAATGRAWRLGDIEFGITGDRSASSKGAYRDSSGDMGGLFYVGDPPEDDPGVRGTERITLLASVTLKSAVS